MYRSFYGLRALPFKIDTDPTFLWLGEKHREAISMLKYGIQGEGHTGILLLTGDVGTGKTTLINALFNTLSKRVIRTSITNPNLEGLDFLNYIAAAFGSKRSFSSKGQFLIHFTRFLKSARAKNRKVLLVVDEAQLLNQTLLEEIRLFSNIEHQGQSLIHTFLIGQSELRRHLAHPENRALDQRISLNYHIDALVYEETQEYIKYRLQVAGAKEQIFTQDAVGLIHKFSSGLPRMINIICDHALLTGYVQNSKSIGAPIIQECARELAVPIAPQAMAPQGFQDRYPADPWAHPGPPDPVPPPLPRPFPEPGMPERDMLERDLLERDPARDLARDPVRGPARKPAFPSKFPKGSQRILAAVIGLALIAAALAGYLFLF